MLTMETIQRLAAASSGMTPDQIEAALAASKNVEKLGDLKQMAAFIAALAG